MIGAEAGLLADVSLMEALLGLVGAASTIFGIVWVRRGNREVQKLSAEEGAYARASEIDAGIVQRLETERDYLGEQLTAEREGRAEERARWEQEKAQLRAEAARLESRLRELLDEVIALRSRHDVHDSPQG